MTIYSEAEEKYPGITKYGCLDPYYNFELMGPKCMSCQRNSKCRKEAALEMSRVDEDYPYSLKAKRDLGLQRKKKSGKSKVKRKCRCK